MDKKTKYSCKNVGTAVIGGGPSGVYCSWRLKEAGTKVTLFELSNRIGGRLFSKTLPGAPHIHTELGGMRYQPTTHPLVNGVINHFKIDSKEFPMGTLTEEINGIPQYSTDNNILFLRGKYFREKDLKDPNVALPYNLPWSLQGKSANELQEFAMNHVLPHTTNNVADDYVLPVYGDQNGIPQRASDFTQEQLLNYRFKVYNQTFRDIGYWNLLYRTLGNEGFNLLKDANGYDSNVPNGNSPALLPTSDYGSSTHFRTLVNGYDSLPKRIHQEFTDLGGKTNFNHRLKSIKNVPKKDGSARYLLTFIETITCPRRYSTKDCVTEGEVDGYIEKQITKIRYLCDNVILSMPRKSVELIEWHGFRDEQVQELINSVIIQPSNKLILGYEQPWWRSQGIMAGRSISDTPLRMSYYFGTEGEQKGADKNNLNSCILASYSDMINVQFWKGLERGKPYKPRPNNFYADGEYEEISGEKDDSNVPILAATEEMVLEAHRMLEELHGFRPDSLPKPYVAMYQAWDGYYGGGYHAWKAGYDYNDVIRKIRQPHAKENVFITGSAYSNNQAWVEGAFAVSERVLQSPTFNLGLPQYLPEDLRNKQSIYGP